ncbi:MULTISPECIES: undecaprenyl-diphosphate phosphatase [unclassified Schlesneria]|uniref:undecaprenyl-diphosphate phosphatase n=1 Tax=Schlesneria TaxID=656899 RepID=UPI0035C82E70
MNDTVRVLILAVVQGVAEFLPISSSGHLVIIDELLRQGKSVEDEAMTLNIVLHLGTLGSIITVYFQRLKRIILEADLRLCAAIVLASIPAGLVGVLFKKRLEPLFENAWIAGCGLLVTGTLLLLSQRVKGGNYNEKEMPWWVALMVGCFQAVALVPGISRSGSTISGGMLAGLQRESAGTFSFLIAIPAIGGAALLDAVKLLKQQGGNPEAIPGSVLLMGMGVSFIVGIIALRLLLTLISKQRLHVFGYYCLAAGTATLIWKGMGH